MQRSGRSSQAWLRATLGWIVAIGGATSGATAGFAGSAALRGGVDLRGIVDVALFAAVYSVCATTVLGPPTLYLLRRSGRTSALAFTLAGTLAGLFGMLFLNVLAGTPQWNLLPETGAIAGAAAALASHRFWVPRPRGLTAVGD